MRRFVPEFTSARLRSIPTPANNGARRNTHGHAANCPCLSKQHQVAPAPQFLTESKQLVARVRPERSRRPEYQKKSSWRCRYNGPAHQRRAESRYTRSAGTRGARERAPCVWCSRMLYRSSNAATSGTALFAYESTARIVTGQRAPMKATKCADVAGPSGVDSRAAVRRRRRRAPNRARTRHE